MWPFNKVPKIKKVPRVLKIPEEKLIEFWKLYQVYIEAPKGSDYVVKYELWVFLEAIFPEIADPAFNLKVNSDHIRHPKLVEVFEK